MPDPLIAHLRCCAGSSASPITSTGRRCGRAGSELRMCPAHTRLGDHEGGLLMHPRLLPSPARSSLLYVQGHGASRIVSRKGAPLVQHLVRGQRLVGQGSKRHWIVPGQLTVRGGFYSSSSFITSVSPLRSFLTKMLMRTNQFLRDSFLIDRGLSTVRLAPVCNHLPPSPAWMGKTERIVIG